MARTMGVPVAGPRDAGLVAGLATRELRRGSGRGSALAYPAEHSVIGPSNTGSYRKQASQDGRS